MAGLPCGIRRHPATWSRSARLNWVIIPYWTERSLALKPTVILLTLLLFRTVHQQAKRIESIIKKWHGQPYSAKAKPHSITTVLYFDLTPSFRHRGCITSIFNNCRDYRLFRINRWAIRDLSRTYVVYVEYVTIMGMIDHRAMIFNCTERLNQGRSFKDRSIRRAALVIHQDKHECNDTLLCARIPTFATLICFLSGEETATRYISVKAIRVSRLRTHA